MGETSKYWELHELNEDAIIFEEFASAYMGYGTKLGLDKPVAVYDARQMVKIFAEGLIANQEWVKEQDINTRDGLEDLAIQDAVEYIEYNVFGMDVGENGPIFLHTYMY